METVVGMLTTVGMLGGERKMPGRGFPVVCCTAHWSCHPTTGTTGSPRRHVLCRSTQPCASWYAPALQSALRHTPADTCPPECLAEVWNALSLNPARPAPFPSSPCGNSPSQWDLSISLSLLYLQTSVCTPPLPPASPASFSFCPWNISRSKWPPHSLVSVSPVRMHAPWGQGFLSA